MVAAAKFGTALSCSICCKVCLWRVSQSRGSLHESVKLAPVGGGLENRICQTWREGTYNDLESRWLESMPSEYIASCKPTLPSSRCIESARNHRARAGALPFALPIQP